MVLKSGHDALEQQSTLESTALATVHMPREIMWLSGQICETTSVTLFSIGLEAGRIPNSASGYVVYAHALEMFRHSDPLPLGWRLYVMRARFKIPGESAIPPGLEIGPVCV